MTSLRPPPPGPRTLAQRLFPAAVNPHVRACANQEPHFGFTSIWEGWAPDSGLLPTPVYCRHCVLASQKPTVPQEAADSFLDETFLCDRRTTLREYLDRSPHVMATEPPPELVGRYSG